MNTNYSKNTDLTIDTNYRGTISVSLLTIKKTILYALRDITEHYFVDKIECKLFDDVLLHIYIAGKVLQKDSLNYLTEEINDSIIKELSYSLKLKPKNISITFRH